MVPCGHHQPDNEKTSWKAMADDFKEESSVDVTFKTDHTTTNGK